VKLGVATLGRHQPQTGIRLAHQDGIIEASGPEAVEAGVPDSLKVTTAHRAFAPHADWKELIHASHSPL
jgi:hypothetical protein